MAERSYLDYEGLQHFYEKLVTRFGGGLRFKSSVATVAALPAIADLTVKNVGDEYSIQAAGKTTADFVEGAGKKFSAGTNVALANIGTTTSPILKWDLLGSAFDRLAYGTAMPTDAEDGEVFLYLGATTYKYTAVASPTGNPQAQGWYVESGSDYVLTTDTEVQTGTTYYTRAEEYVQGVIYKYNGTDSVWEALSSGDTMVAITTSEIDALFE